MRKLMLRPGKAWILVTTTGESGKNMGKNDLWIVAVALYFDMDLHTADNDFEHLPSLGLRLVKNK